MAKFKVGDRVRIVGCTSEEYRYHLGMQGVIVRPAEKDVPCSVDGRYFDWVVDVGAPIHEPTDLLASEVQKLEEHLEPITDTWAQDKVAQLVKQCMPVAA